MTQPDLFDIPESVRFDGTTFDQQADEDRLKTQLGRVHSLMANGAWWTLKELAERSGGTEASVSARLRDLRKERFGGYTVERQRVPGANGLWQYRIVTGSRK